MEPTQRRRLSKTISHALRHDPGAYELVLESDGWIKVDALVGALGRLRRFSQVDQGAIEEVVRHCPKQRFELDGAGRIRARYGHSVAERVERQPAQPPARLYHGTPPDVVEAVLADGLRPMSRQVVHMSTDIPGALEVGRRHGRNPVLLVIHAAQAWEAGHAFYEGNEKVWLADFVPGEFIEVREG